MLYFWISGDRPLTVAGLPTHNISIHFKYIALNNLKINLEEFGSVRLVFHVYDALMVRFHQQNCISVNSILHCVTNVELVKLKWLQFDIITMLHVYLEKAEDALVVCSKMLCGLVTNINVVHENIHVHIEIYLYRNYLSTSRFIRVFVSIRAHWDC